MKRILLIISIIAILFLTGCNLSENVKNTNLSEKENQQQEVVDDNDAVKISFRERTKEFDKLEKEIEDSAILISDSYDHGIQLKEKSIGDIILERQDDNYVLNISVLNAVSFEKAEIDAVVKNMEDNNIETAKLGDFTISKTASAEQKERLDFMKENDVLGMELDFWKEYTNTNWLDEDGIPVYIQSDIYGAGDYLWALEKVKDASSDRYYMFRIQIAYPSGLYSVLDSSSVSQIKINLLASDKVNVKEYEFGLEEYYDFGLKNEENTTIEEYFNKNSNGKNSIAIDTRNIKMENDIIYLEFYNGGI